MTFRFPALALFLFAGPFLHAELAIPEASHAAAAAIGPADQVAQTTVILVRHAEKADAPADDPPLTASGHTRAQLLAAAVADAGISAIYSTRYQRTQQTAAPVSVALGIPVTTLDPAARGDAYGVAYARAILEHSAGGAILVVGHSNTIPQILAGLGVRGSITIADDEYSNLFVVTVSGAGAARLIRSEFGAR
jgi:phosphohistidine phosphatase SixA